MGGAGMDAPCETPALSVPGHEGSRKRNARHARARKREARADQRSSEVEALIAKKKKRNRKNRENKKRRRNEAASATAAAAALRGAAPGFLAPMLTVMASIAAVPY